MNPNQIERNLKQNQRRLPQSMELDECDLEMFGAKFAKGHMLSKYNEKPGLLYNDRKFKHNN